MIFRNRGYLPHMESEEGIYFVTFRLADSLPSSVLAAWQSERNEIVLHARNQKRELSEYELFDGTRYKLHVWCIMPNHVHILFSPSRWKNQSPSDSLLIPILHSWKSYTASTANRILNRKGQFWQEEYFDFWLRAILSSLIMFVTFLRIWSQVDYVKDGKISSIDGRRI